MGKLRLRLTQAGGATLASLALVATMALPAHAEIEKYGTYGSCGVNRVPAAQSLSYGEVKILPPGGSVYYVWWDDAWTYHSRLGVHSGGYWRVVVNIGAMNDWGTYAYCSS